MDLAGDLDRLAAAVPSHVRDVCARLTEAGHQAVVVGGCVRDVLMGRHPMDWDVATSAHPEDVLALFKRTRPQGLQHGTVVVEMGRHKDTHVEVTTFRGEGAYSDAGDEFEEASSREPETTAAVPRSRSHLRIVKDPE